MNTNALKAYLKQRDEAFCKAVAQEGLEAWVMHFAEDGIMVNAKGDIIRGHDMIREAMTGLFKLNQLKFVWTPIDASVSTCGTLGYTYGDYVRTYVDETGKVVEASGRYTTVWRKQMDGTWLIELDTGN